MGVDSALERGRSKVWKSLISLTKFFGLNIEQELQIVSSHDG